MTRRVPWQNALQMVVLKHRKVEIQLFRTKVIL